MRIQRYIAKDMRSALAQVREALGADAVILSSGRVGSEVEVVAAIDMEVARAVEQSAPGRSHLATRGEETVAARYESRPDAVRPDAARQGESRHSELLTRRSSSQLSLLEPMTRPRCGGSPRPGPGTNGIGKRSSGT